MTSAIWEFWVGARSAPVDTSWGSTLDVNGDGLPDLAVGAPLVQDNLGRAYVYLGTANGFSTAPSTTLVGHPLASAPAQGFFGNTVSSAGDLNGDGYGDLVVGAMSDSDGDPLAYVYLGGPSGVGTTPQIILTDHKDGGYAASVAAGGDVNGDGFGDLIVGESTDDWATTHAWVYFGGGDGIVASSATELEGPTVPGAIDGPIVARAGDVNGGGYADVFVGADYFINRQGGTSMVYLGGPSGPSTTPQVTITAPNGDNLIYGSTPPCAIDVDGDGYADLALRGPSLPGNILLYRGGPSGITSSVPSSTELVAPVDDLAYGVALASGDVDGDGFADVAVGAFREEQDTGRAFLFAGSASGLAPTPTTTFDAPDGGRFGNALASDVSPHEGRDARVVHAPLPRRPIGV